MAPKCELFCLSLSQFLKLLKIKWYVLLFDTRQFIRSFDKFCSFRNDICIFCIFNPKKQTEQRFYGSFGAQGFTLELKVSEGIREHLHIHLLSFCLLVFENSCQSLIEYSTVTFAFDPCPLLPTGYCKRAKTIRFGACSDIKKWLLNWLHFTLLIFIKLNVNYGNINWVDTFFWLSL